jgi:DNA-binding transcriptional LysR family regulator
MNVRQIEAFRAVMTAGTTKGAAEMLRVSQPAISRLIGQLERSLRFDLFDRSKGRLTPTHEAQLLFEEVERTFRSLDKIAERAADIREGKAGSIKMAVLPALAFGFLPRVVRAFADRHPGTAVSIHIPTSERIAEWAASQQIDFGIAVDAAPRTGIEIEEFCRDAYRLAVPVGHRLAARAAVGPEDLEGERFLSYTANNSVRQFADKVFQRSGVTRILTAEAQYSAALAELVAQDLGVALIDPFTAADPAGRGIVGLRFEPAIEFNLGILYPSHRPLSRAARSFLSLLRAHRNDVLGRCAIGKQSVLTSAHRR